MKRIVLARNANAASSVVVKLSLKRLDHVNDHVTFLPSRLRRTTEAQDSWDPRAICASIIHRPETFAGCAKREITIRRDLFTLASRVNDEARRRELRALPCCRCDAALAVPPN